MQSTVIPLLNNKNNVIVSSETGSGKTFSYLFPIIHISYLNHLKEIHKNKTIIILPTKELCKQIFNEAQVFSNYYTKNTIKVKYFTKSMLESIKGNFDNFINNNDIIVHIIIIIYIDFYS